ncbi:uncharacterized protein T551_02719 [Pneumocystis jirovecii RU7]|uniref:Uncharacterized protein n=1 Tax=Pneumocystis jirovecii (strain RU7) TaxID=1408657 RepID=A0A0W4ZIU7_PNEJ7|nr:uncharacterized protein T551_02719 [Pneumocystis jirovecii RU7]KTW28300.1 hypothetical protein T551_02719 [Pneumocystis jirovecii RU7]
MNIQNNTDNLFYDQKKIHQNRSILRRNFSQISDKVELEEQSRDVDPSVLHLISPHKPLYINEGDMEKEKLFLMKQLQKIKEEIEKYQRDIYKLQKSKKDDENRNHKNEDDLIKSLLDLNNHFLANSSEPKIFVDDTIPSSLPTRVENPIPQLRIFNQLNFHDTSNRIVSSEEHGHLIREHRLKGDCCNGHVFFDVEMLVDEGTLSVISLNVKTSPWAYSELHEFLVLLSSLNNLHELLISSRMMKDKNVNNVFYGISSYSKLSSIRCNLFSRLSNKYPQLLSYSGNYVSEPSKRQPDEFFGIQYLHFIHKNGFELTLHWKIKIDSITADASSDISANPRYPESWELFDENKALRKINVMFQKMIKCKGVYNASILLLSSVFQVDS